MVGASIWKPLTLWPLSLFTRTIVPSGPQPLMTSHPWLGGAALITKSFTRCVPVATLGCVAGLAKNGPEAGYAEGPLS